MSDVVAGILAVLAGVMLCFFGYWTLRLLLSVWGAVIGFGLGSSFGTWLSDDSYLTTALGWIVGLVLALVFAVLAYLYYVVAVVLAFASMGFAIGTAFMGMIGVTWSWVVVTVGVLIGLAVAFIAIVADVPTFLLLALSSFGGAAVIVTGLMLLTGVVGTVDFSQAVVTDDIDAHWWWSALLVVIAIVGFVSQLSRPVNQGGIRDTWLMPVRH